MRKAEKIMDNTNSVIFPNVHEYMKRGMGQFSESLLAEWRSIAAGYGEVSLLWQGKNKLILAPRPIDDDLLSYHRTAWGMDEVCAVTPQSFTSDTAGDFLADKNAMDTIHNFLGRHQKSYFIPWGATEGAYEILKSLDSSGVINHEIPKKEDYWSSLYYDTKIGFKELCFQLGIRVPKGYACDSLKMALSVIRGFCLKGEACVLKANSGAGGFGNIFITKDMLSKSFHEVESYIYSSIEELPYFRQGAMLVEEWIEIPASSKLNSADICSGFASAEILPDGKVRVIAGGIDTHDSSGYYSGARLGKGVLPVKLWNYLKNVLLKLGDSIAECGYRGHWGINYMLRCSGEPVLIELNPRRCGESHVHNIATVMAGEDWMESLYIINRFPMEVRVEREVSVRELLDQFDSVNKKYSEATAVPVQLSWLKKERYQGIGYMILGEEETVVRQDRDLRERLADMGLRPVD